MLFVNLHKYLHFFYLFIGCLDLTPAVWGQLEENTSIGVLPITWQEYKGDGGNDDEESDKDDEET